MLLLPRLGKGKIQIKPNWPYNPRKLTNLISQKKKSTKKMKMKQAKDNQKIDPARYNFSINLGITKHNFLSFIKPRYHDKIPKNQIGSPYTSILYSHPCICEHITSDTT